jgi:hypothetical protein
MILPFEYRGKRMPDGDAKVIILHEDSLDGYGTEPLKHHVRHSPTGFSWGYGGSGPAELARCILLDYAERIGDDDKSFYEDNYQRFKWLKIATAKGTTFVISSQEIAVWVENIRE